MAISKRTIKPRLILRYMLLMYSMGAGACYEFNACEAEIRKPKEYQICDEHDCRWKIKPRYEWIRCENIDQMHMTTKICEESNCALTFTKNYGSILRTNAFVALPKIEQIFLNDSNIEQLQKGSFTGLPLITVIHLERNKISEISNGVFTLLPELRILDLSRNVINETDEDCFQGSKSIEFLDLSYNNLRELTTGIFQPLYKLRMLNISHNFLKEIDESWCHHLHFMKYLILDNNNIESLINCSFNVNIEVLSLSGNHLTTLNESVFPRSLKELHLSDNNISNITYGAFENLEYLKLLYISENNISTIPIGVFNYLGNLSTLDLSGNRIENLDYGIFHSLTNMTFVNLTNNNIAHLEARIFIPLVNLTRIDISKNYLEFFDVEYLLKSCHKLKFLEISGNHFSCSTLAHIISYAQNRNILVPHGRMLKTQNINGIACTIEGVPKNEDIVRISKETKNFLVDYFEKDFKKSSFFKFVENFSVPNQNQESNNYSNEMIEIQRNLAKNVNDIKEILYSENSFFQKFLDLSSNFTEFNNKHVDKPIASQAEFEEFKKFENSSFKQFLYEFSNMLNKSKADFKILRRTNANTRSTTFDQIQTNTNAALQSDNSRLEKVTTSLNQMKLFFILCILIFVTFCAVKITRFMKIHFVTNEDDNKEDQEMPIMNHSSA